MGIASDREDGGRVVFSRRLYMVTRFLFSPSWPRHDSELDFTTPLNAASFHRNYIKLVLFVSCHVCTDPKQTWPCV